MIDLAQQGIDAEADATSIAKRRWSRTMSARNSISTTPDRAGHRAGRSSQLRQAADSTANNQLLGNPDLPLEQFPPTAGQGRARPTPQRNLDHDRAARADRRHRDAGRPASSSAASSPPARRYSASSTSPIPGSTPIRRNPTSPMSPSAKPSTIDVDAFPDHVFKGTVGSLSPAPARNSRSCRRRTPPAISSRWCSACRCGSISTATTTDVRKLKAGMSVYATIDTGHRRSLAALLGLSPAAAASRTESHETAAAARSRFPACAGTW